MAALALAVGSLSGCGGAGNSIGKLASGVLSSTGTNTSAASSSGALPHQVWTLDMAETPTVYGPQITSRGIAANLKAMQADGIDAVTVDIFHDPNRAAPLLAVADTMSGMVVGPLIDLSTMNNNHYSHAQMSSAASAAIQGYCALAAMHRGAATASDGRPIVWIYGTELLAPSDWQSVLAAVHAARCNPFVIGADGGNPAHYSPLWNATYSFFPAPAASSSSKALTQSGGSSSQPVVATMMPQYTRLAAGHLMPGDNGSRYSQQWQSAVSTGAALAIVISWDDTGDGTQIAGNPTLERLTRLYAAQWKKAVGA